MDDFNPQAHMEGPFKAFLEAAQYCAEQGWLVSMRPDEDDDWRQQLFIFPANSLLARPGK